MVGSRSRLALAFLVLLLLLLLIEPFALRSIYFVTRRFITTVLRLETVCLLGIDGSFSTSLPLLYDDQVGQDVYERRKEGHSSH